MESLSQILPIFIYVLLIVLIVVCIILGIKIIITIDKVTKVVDDVNEKIEKVTPIFNTVGMISDRMSNVLATVFGFVESLIGRLFLKNNKKNEESEEDE